MNFLFAADIEFNWETHTWWQDHLPLILATGLASFLVWRFLMSRDAPPAEPSREAAARPRPLLPLATERPAVRMRPPPAPRRVAPALPLTSDGRPEHRKNLRREGNPVEVLISDAAAKAEPRPGQVINRSRGGLCLQVPEAIPVGTTLCVRAVQAPEEVPWTRLEVKNSRKTGDHWELGVKFETELSWNLLLLFG